MPSVRNVNRLRVKASLWMAAGLATATLLAGCQTPDGPVAPHPTPLTPTPPAGTSTSTPTPPVAVKPIVPAAPADPVVATVGATAVHLSELQPPLLQAYGFSLLMLLLQRNMARDACLEQNVPVTAAEIKYENDWTLGRMFADAREDDDREKLLEQYLAQPKPAGQMSTHAEWDIVMDTNAHLRKLVEPKLKKAITDDMLQQQFDEEYGAQAHVRDIQVSNPQEGADIQRRLAAGEDFASLAGERSRDPNTKRLGGELAPFSMHSSRPPDDYKRVAFSLKPGEVSDLVMAAGGYHLIKMERIEAPKAVKFADVKDSLRQDTETKLIIDGVAKLRTALAQQALATLKVEEPTLKAELDERLHARDKLIQDRDKIRQEMEKQRGATTAPATGPATATSTGPTTAPATMPAVAAPQAVPKAPAPVAPPIAPPPVVVPPPVAPTPAPVAPPAPPPAPKPPAAPAMSATRPAATTATSRP